MRFSAASVTPVSGGLRSSAAALIASTVASEGAETDAPWLSL
jgi:shikimate kinase